MTPTPTPEEQTKLVRVNLDPEDQILLEASRRRHRVSTVSEALRVLIRRDNPEAQEAAR